MAEKPVKCPRCDFDLFEEFSVDICSQKYVRIGSKGNKNYSLASPIKALSTVRVLGFECMKCQAKFILKDNRLVEQPSIAVPESLHIPKINI